MRATAELTEGAPVFAPLPGGPFSTVVADPPWDYSRKLSGGGTSGYSPVHHSRGGNRGARNHYATLQLDELKLLPVREVVQPKAHLYLWTTGAFLTEAHELAVAWGFEPKGLIPWVKTKRNAAAAVAKSGDLRAGVRMGMGLYIRWCTEYVLFGVRGKLGTHRNDALGIVFAPRGDHSTKPAEMYDLIKTLSPGPRLDVFARQHREGFIAWGNEAPS